MRDARWLGWIAVALAIGGCRDLRATAGRLGAQHVVSGRAGASLRPLTTDEVAAGVFYSSDSDVAPLQAWLRSSVAARAGLARGIEPEGAGAVLVFGLDPSSTTFGTATLNPSAVLGAPFAILPGAALMAEYEAACRSPLLRAALGGCGDTFSFGAADTFVDDIDLTPLFASATVSWVPPSDTLNPLADVRERSGSLLCATDFDCVSVEPDGPGYRVLYGRSSVPERYGAFPATADCPDRAMPVCDPTLGPRACRGG